MKSKKMLISILFILVLILPLLYFKISDNFKNKDDCMQDTDELKIIGSYHEDMIKSLVEVYAKENNCKVSYVRMPTQVAQKRLIAEKDKPVYDVWIGGTVDAHELLKLEGVLKACTTKEEKNISSRYLDKDGVWKAQYIEVLSIGINVEKWEKNFSNIDMPKTLEDLLNPAYKGEIIMPNPTTSGTGYTFIAAVLEKYGEEKGWDYLEKLNNQIGQYTDSGYTASERVGFGEYLICINFLSDQQLIKSLGYPLESIVYDKAGWSAVPVSLVKVGAYACRGKDFINFCLSKEAGDILVGLGDVMTVRDDCIKPRYNLSNTDINTDFSPLSNIDKKEERVKRFSDILP